MADVDANGDGVCVLPCVNDLDETAEVNLSELVIKNQWRTGRAELHGLRHGAERVDCGALP
jgi:hypothetical protein